MSEQSRTKRTHRCPPDHKHGANATCWGRHGCGCTPCLDAHRDRCGNRRKQIAYGRHRGLIPAGPTRRRIEVLRAAGWTVSQIAAISGVAKESVNRAGLGHGKLVRPETADKIAALNPNAQPPVIYDNALVDATGTIRRLQALLALGWSGKELMRRIGANESYQTRVLNHPLVMERTRRAVAELYDELWDQSPPVTNRTQAHHVRRAKNRARVNGWVPPLAWDDDTIDDPGAVPAAIPARAPLTVLDDLESLRSAGESATTAARLLERKQEALARYARRHDRPDLARWLERKAA